MKSMRHLFFTFALATLLALPGALGFAKQEAVPQAAGEDGSAFSYQGRLSQGGAPASGTYDFVFIMFDDEYIGNQLGAIILDNVPVKDGYFSALLNYGFELFQGEGRWLEVRVRASAGSGNYSVLTPRQALTAAPYALHARSVPWYGLIGMPEWAVGGYVAGSGLTLDGNTFRVDTSSIQARIGSSCGTGFAIREVNADGTVLCEPVGGVEGGITDVHAGTGLSGGRDSGEVTLSLNTAYTDGRYWMHGGSILSGTGVFGTTSNHALDFRVNNSRALRLAPHATSPNFIGGHSGNWVTSGVYGATIGGGGESGTLNRVTANFGTVGGGWGNQTSGANSTIGGGWDNEADGTNSTVGGGRNNWASGSSSIVGGGWYNRASGSSSTIGGGVNNQASGDLSTISGGDNNEAIGYGSTMGGGIFNRASGTGSTLGGGIDNGADGDDSTIGGGNFNWAYGYGSTVGGGYDNQASGVGSTIPGGRSNTADGDNSFAAGQRAKANNQGCFVWGDSTDAEVTCSNNNRWVARASGGVYFYTNSTLSSGVFVPAGGGSWSSVSDRNLKENLEVVEGREILERVTQLPITTWNYLAQDASIRHLGPMAQDFYAAFGLGEDDVSIATIDLDGVALAAIQGLAEIVEEQAERIEQLEARLVALETGMDKSASPSTSFGGWGLFGLVLAGMAVVSACRHGKGQS
jgi:trimeric autotransporter adhesin